MQNENITSGIYCIENIENNKKYIGQSKDINDRWRRHISELNHGKHDNDYLQKSWNKYGVDCFKFYVLEYCNIEKLDEKEKYYIELYNTLNRDLGYNLKSGGQNGGSVYSKETCRKMSKSVKQSYDESLIDKRRQDALNQWSNPEIKEKHIGYKNGMYGKHHSEKTKNKIREIAKKKRKKKEIRKILCIELNKVYDNASVAAREISGINASNILNVCYGKRQTTGGFHFKFVEDIYNNENNNGEII